jgi:hypothetical protein
MKLLVPLYHTNLPLLLSTKNTNVFHLFNKYVRIFRNIPLYYFIPIQWLPAAYWLYHRQHGLHGQLRLQF